MGYGDTFVQLRLFSKKLNENTRLKPVRKRYFSTKEI